MCIHLIYWFEWETMPKKLSITIWTGLLNAKVWIVLGVLFVHLPVSCIP